MLRNLLTYAINHGPEPTMTTSYDDILQHHMTPSLGRPSVPTANSPTKSPSTNTSNVEAPDLPEFSGHHEDWEKFKHSVGVMLGKHGMQAYLFNEQLVKKNPLHVQAVFCTLHAALNNGSMRYKSVSDYETQNWRPDLLWT